MGRNGESVKGFMPLYNVIYAYILVKHRKWYIKFIYGL